MAKKASTKVEEEIKRLRSSCQLWNVYSTKWTFYQDAYEGGDDFIQSNNLFKHTRETPSDYAERVKRLHNVNYCEPLVDFFTNFIFSEVIDRNGGKNQDWFDKFRMDVNLRGDNIDEFMRSVSDDSQIYGMSYIIVDTPQVDPLKIVTKADEYSSGIRPYWCLVKPAEIKDWVTDDFGTYQYVKRMQVNRKVYGPGDIATIEKYTEFYPDRFEVTEIDVTDPSKPQLGPKIVTLNALKEVPIVVARHKRSKACSDMGLSFLRDFAGNNREILNLTSLEQEFLYRQAFNILARQTDGSIELADQHEGVIGSANVMDYPMGTKPPAYIAPPPEAAKYIQDKISRLKNDMYMRASQDAMNELFNGEGSSGFSQAQSFGKTVPFISSRADVLEQTEKRLLSLTLKWIGKEWDGKIKYKDRYDLTNFTDSLTQFQILARDLQMPSEKFVKEQLKRLYHEFDGKLSVEDALLIDKQIDTMDFTGWLETQKQALIGTPKQEGNSPGAQQKSKSTGTTKEVASESNNASTNKVKK